MTDGEINFYSISGDGRVFNWVLMQSKLAITTIITLYLDKEQTGGPDGSNIKLKGTFFLVVTHFKQNIIFVTFIEYIFILRMWNMYDFSSETARNIFSWY